jgi:acyl-CoA thioester hydrolase
MPTHNKLPLYVEMPFQPKTYDIDFAGHVSNIVYIRWLEDLRNLLLETYLPLDKLMESGVGPVVMRTTIEYRKPAKLFDRLLGKMWMSEMGTVKGILSAEFSVNGDIVARAEQTGLFVKMASGKPVPVPYEFRRQFDAVAAANA